MRTILSVSMALLVLCSGVKEVTAKDDTEISGTAYLFYYHDASKEDGKNNAFDLERVYLNFKKSLSEKFKIRITTDIGRIKSITDLNWETYQITDTQVIDNESLIVVDSDTREKKGNR